MTNVTTNTSYTLQKTNNIWEFYKIFKFMTEMLEYFMCTTMEEILLKVSFHSAGNVQSVN